MYTQIFHGYFYSGFDHDFRLVLQGFKLCSLQSVEISSIKGLLLLEGLLSDSSHEDEEHVEDDEISVSLV